MEEKDFLKNFDKRMKSVGRYAVLCGNSFDKKIWKEYGIQTHDEQMNMLFTLLLYIMEYSLREEDCTMDNIALFLEDVNYEYFDRRFTFEESIKLAKFMVEDVLGNAGKSMYFQAFDYGSRMYKEINIRYIGNKVVYQDTGVKRTSYFLTEEGYNMVLATMELENNLKLTIHEMLFKLHLEKADYGKAVDDIKNIFGELRKQSQRIVEAAHAIKRNALAYSVEDYKSITEENISAVVESREKFNMHRQFIEEKLKEFEEKEMDEEEFTAKEKDNLNHLRQIGGYLTRTLEEHQKIFSQHFDLKKLYEYELENYSNMNLVQRFPFRSGVYDLVIKDANLLKNVDKICNPLYFGQMDKRFNPEKMFAYQKRLKKGQTKDEDMELDFDEEAYNKEREQKRLERRKRYEGSIRVILNQLLEKGKVTLREFSLECSEEERKELLPSAEIFREIIIEFLTEETIDIEKLRKEQMEYLLDTSEGFVLNEMLLAILEDKKYRKVGKIYIFPIEDEEYVHFYNVTDEMGNRKNFKCSNIGFRYEER